MPLMRVISEYQNGSPKVVYIFKKMFILRTPNRISSLLTNLGLSFDELSDTGLVHSESSKLELQYTLLNNGFRVRIGLL